MKPRPSPPPLPPVHTYQWHHRQEKIKKFLFHQRRRTSWNGFHSSSSFSVVGTLKLSPKHTRCVHLSKMSFIFFSRIITTFALSSPQACHVSIHIHWRWWSPTNIRCHAGGRNECPLSPSSSSFFNPRFPIRDSQLSLYCIAPGCTVGTHSCAYTTCTYSTAMCNVQYTTVTRVRHFRHLLTTRHVVFCVLGKRWHAGH